MQQLSDSAMRESILQIEHLRESKVIVLAASNLDIDLLPPLYEQLRELGKVKRLDLVLHCRGGVVNATRRIALLFRAFAEEFNIIVPYFCQSSGTLLCLAADQIIAGELAMFSPIDPHLQGGSDADGAMSSSFSAMDILAFGEMAENWFGIEANEARTESLALLCNSIIPPSLAAFYRCTKELQQIALELLAFQLRSNSIEQREKIVQHLVSAYHSHSYAITGEELSALGLRIVRNQAVEDLAWELSTILQAHVGGAQRESLDDPWINAVIASAEKIRRRTQRIDGLASHWTLNATAPVDQP